MKETCYLTPMITSILLTSGALCIGSSSFTGNTPNYYISDGGLGESPEFADELDLDFN